MEDKALETILENFGAVHRRLDSVDRRLGSVDHRLDSMDQRFEAIEGRLDGLGERIEQVRFESAERDQKLDQRIRDMHDTIQLVAEGVMHVDEKLDRFRAETAAEFDEVRAEMRAGYTRLDQRIRNLEQTQ